jgi:hypothetical protein
MALVKNCVLDTASTSIVTNDTLKPLTIGRGLSSWISDVYYDGQVVCTAQELEDWLREKAGQSKGLVTKLNTDYYR